MFDSLRFVQGAVAKKDFVPSLTHFHIAGGRVRGYNGMVGLCAPIDIDLAISPKAGPFVKAIQTCSDTIQLHLAPSGKLVVKSGPFKAHIECLPGDLPDMEPEGTEIPLAGGLLNALKLLQPFIAEDASRPWARGILFKGQSAFVTNNIILIEHWLGSPFPVAVNIPRMAVMELLRIGEEPDRMQLCETSVTFHFPQGRWLRTQTYSTEWPDLTRILDRPNEQRPIPPTLWEALLALVPFVDDAGRVHLLDGAIATSLVGNDGATTEVVGIVPGGCFNCTQMRLLEGVAVTADFSGFPKPCIFYGTDLRGAIVGVRG